MWLRSPRFWSWTILALVLLGFVLGGYFSPWWVVRQIREDALADNGFQISQYVDFEQVRLNLVEQMKNQIAIKFDALGKSSDQEAQALANEEAVLLINRIVNPQGIADLLNQAYTSKIAGKELKDLVKEGATKIESGKGKSELILSDGYGANLSQFFIKISDTASSAQTVTIQLHREGFLGWKIINILLPLGF
ncbi:MAG: DUF2939 domain-containing protein [Burkholderiales bacterium]|nr:DUF2939 domain-containing protein [Burkholderiales bacterium]